MGGTDAGPSPGSFSAAKKIGFTAVFLALLWGFAEFACWGGLWALARYKHLEYAPKLVRTLSPKHRGILTSYLSGQPSYIIYSRTLGWTIRPHGATNLYHANGEGLRADHDFPASPPPGRVRVAAFGDSFTHSSDVEDAAAWEVALERLEPRLEVMNFGVPGYGVDQAYLRYLEEGERFAPRIVLIDFMTDNINRVVNVFRPFFFYQSGLPLTKPRFLVRDGKLSLLANPIQSVAGYRDLLDHTLPELDALGQHDYFYQRRYQRSRLDFLPSVRFAHVVHEQRTEPMLNGLVYNTRSEPFAVTVGIFDAFYGEALRHGALPILVFFPDRRDIRAFREGRGKVYQPLLDDARRKGHRTIDLMDGFARYGGGAELSELAHVHYTRRGYGMVAQWILDSLRAGGLTTPEGVQAALAAESRPTQQAARPGGRRAPLPG
jgi:hypothetical protein